MKKQFKIIVPAEITKSKDGNFKVRGLASTDKIDSQGEIVVPSGVDLTPIEQGRGLINWEHQPGPENTLGLLDGYTRIDNGFYIEGRLFKKHEKAKAVKQIMESLEEGDKGRMGLSLEGAIIQRDSENPNIIQRCIVDQVAMTMKPVNSDTHVDLVKSLTTTDTENFEFAATSPRGKEAKTTYSANQVVELLVKALSVGSGSLAAPDTRSGGDALVVEDFGPKRNRTKKAGISKTDQHAENLEKILNQLQILYPEYSREVLWGNLKDRLETKFPS